MLFVSTLVVLLGVNIAETLSEPWWFQIFKQLPVGRNSKIGLGAAWSYGSSKKGDKIENVVDEVFHILAGITKENINIAEGEKYNPFNLGHICWSEGKAEGMNTIVKEGKVETVTKEGKTWHEVKFPFENLKITVDRCGLKISKKKNTGTCVMDAGKAVFKVKFTVHNIDSYKHLLVGLLEKRCIFTIVNVELEKLNGFKVDVQNDKGSYTNPMIESFTKTPLMKKLITVLGRVSLYENLEKSGSFLCKDHDLDVYVQQMHKQYLAYVDKKMKPHGNSRTPTFHELCDNGWMQSVEDRVDSGVDKMIYGIHIDAHDLLHLKRGLENSGVTKMVPGALSGDHQSRLDDIESRLHLRKRDILKRWIHKKLK